MKLPKGKSSCQPFTNITEEGTEVTNRWKEKPTLESENQPQKPERTAQCRYQSKTRQPAMFPQHPHLLKFNIDLYGRLCRCDCQHKEQAEAEEHSKTGPHLGIREFANGCHK